MVSRCPSCKTSERIASVRNHATVRCNSCGECQIITKHQQPQNVLRRHHYKAAMLGFSCVGVLLLLVKVAHALP